MADKSEFSQRFQCLFNRKYDLTLICEGKEIRASKSKLKKSCPYFEGLLSGSFPDGKGDVIKIDNTSYDVLSVLVKYATFKQFEFKDWDISKWKQLFSTAHEYNFQSLLQHASEVFDINDFDLLDIFDAFPWFIKLDTTQVMDKVWCHVDTYADKLIHLENRQQFLAWPQLFVEAFVQRETLNVVEVDLLDAITEWLEKHANVDLEKVLNHIHWNESSDNNLSKQYWLGWSEDTSYKDKKPRCLESPQTIEQRILVPDYNVAQFGASQELLLKSDDKFASPICISNRPLLYQHNVSLSRPFAINAIKFRFNTARHNSYTVAFSTTDGNRVTVTPEWMSGFSYQELYFEPQIVTRIDIIGNLQVNSLECMYSTNIPALRDSYVVADKNMILSTTDARSFSFQHIDYMLRQKCFVSSLALYLGCDDDHKFELHDSSNKQISVTKLSVAKVGFLRVIVFHFEELLLHQVTVKSEDGIIHVVKAECPASKSLISKATAMKSE